MALDLCPFRAVIPRKESGRVQEVRSPFCPKSLSFEWRCGDAVQGGISFAGPDVEPVFILEAPFRRT